MSSDSLEEKIHSFRRFNRFYTSHLGFLREKLLHSPYSLIEARVIFELANHNNLTASDLCQELGLDAGYLSRTLAHLEQNNLLERIRSENDARQRLIHLTPSGKSAYEMLNQRSNEEAAGILSVLSNEDQRRLVKAMQVIEDILDKELKSPALFYLRSFEPGDMGWVTHRHGVLYAQEYGWDERFEALVAKIVSEFIDNYDPEKERCWIAEMDGEIVGSIFLVKYSETIGKLRMLLVEPKARGLGLGSRLVEECIRHARRVGYQKMTLWTRSILVEARAIYTKFGFKLVKQEPSHDYGRDLVEETWELDL